MDDKQQNEQSKLQKKATIAFFVILIVCALTFFLIRTLSDVITVRTIVANLFASFGTGFFTALIFVGPLYYSKKKRNQNEENADFIKSVIYDDLKAVYDIEEFKTYGNEVKYILRGFNILGVRSGQGKNCIKGKYKNIKFTRFDLLLKNCSNFLRDGFNYEPLDNDFSSVQVASYSVYEGVFSFKGKFMLVQKSGRLPFKNYIKNKRDYICVKTGVENIDKLFDFYCEDYEALKFANEKLLTCIYKDAYLFADNDYSQNIYAIKDGDFYVVRIGKKFFLDDLRLENLNEEMKKDIIFKIAKNDLERFIFNAENED